MLSATYIQVHFRLDFIMEANTMNPDQTAPKSRAWPGSKLFDILMILYSWKIFLEKRH